MDGNSAVTCPSGPLAGVNRWTVGAGTSCRWSTVLPSAVISPAAAAATAGSADSSHSCRCDLAQLLCCRHCSGHAPRGYQTTAAATAGAASPGAGTAAAKPAPAPRRDTTLHAASPPSLRQLITLAVRPYCRASGGQLNVDKSRGLVMGSHAAINGVEPLTGILFPDTSRDPIRHLGILLSSAGAAQQHVDQL